VSGWIPLRRDVSQSRLDHVISMQFDSEWLQVRASLVAFIVRNFHVDGADMNLDESLVDQGIIDSFGLVEITAFISRTHGVAVLEKDMTKESFGSINKMARFIVRRQAGE